MVDDLARALPQPQFLVDLTEDAELLSTRSPLVCVVTYSTTQSITSTTITDILFDEIGYDPEGWHSGSSSAIFTVKESGWYDLDASIYSAGSGSTFREVWWYSDKLAARLPTEAVNGASSSGVVQRVRSEAVWLTAGDELKLQFYHTELASVTIGNAAANLKHRVVIKRLVPGARGPRGLAYYESGTTFPASPTSGDEFFRTDLRGGMLFRYDGTYWLSDDEVTINTVAHRAWNAGNLDECYIPFDSGDLDVYLTRIENQEYSNPANASNYLSFGVYKLTPANASTTITTWDTQSDTAANFNEHVWTTGHLVDVSSHPIVRIIGQVAAGNPGGYGSVNISWRWRAT